MIRCANCKDYHETVADVRECCLGDRRLVTAGVASTSQSDQGHPIGNWTRQNFQGVEYDPTPDDSGAIGHTEVPDFLTGAEPEALPLATDKQQHYIGSLLAQKEHDLGDIDPTTITKRDASKLIDKLKACSWLPRKRAEVEPGLYEDGDGNIWLVYDSSYVDTRLAKRLMTESRNDNTTSIGWTRGAKAPLNRLTAEMAVSKDRAIEFGKAFGFCMRCGRILEDPNSIEAGIGPKCATYF